MIYQVRHRTILRYAAPVRLARFNLRLQPSALNQCVGTCLFSSPSLSLKCLQLNAGPPTHAVYCARHGHRLQPGRFFMRTYCSPDLSNW